MLRSLLIAATLLTAFPGAPALAHADDRHHGDDERERGREPPNQREEREDDRKREEPPRRGKSLDQAVREAERQYNAQVISTQTRRQGERTVYLLKLLNKDGKVWTVTVDAGG